MKNDLEKERGFTVYEFMVKELGLSGNALLVYALIYSFSRCGCRYYGTQEYISERIGCAISTVARLLGMLLSANLITKVYEKGYNTPFYSTKDLHGSEENSTNDGIKKTVDFNNPTHSFSVGEPLIFGDNNKEIINTTSSTSSLERACAKRGNSTISFLRYGLNGIVTMTEEQHEAFCNLVGDEMAEIYVNRLETYLIANPSLCLKSHYKTLCKWAREDSAL